MPVAIISLQGKQPRSRRYFVWNLALLGCNSTSIFSQDIAAICLQVNAWIACSTFTMKRLTFILMVSMKLRRIHFANCRLLRLQVRKRLGKKLQKKPCCTYKLHGRELLVNY